VTTAHVAAYAVTVDTAPPVVSAASTTASLMSPNGDGYRDAVRLALATTGASRWTIVITNGAGTAVRSAGGAGSSVSWTWSGAGDGGARVADGRYTATLSGWDVAGNHAGRTFAITVDTTAPSIAARTSAAIFSPNGDGIADATTLSWTANEPATGTARLYRGTTLVRSWTVTNTAAWHVAWNGRNAAGAALADGTYTFRVSVKDAGGNPRTVSIPVVVDRTAGFLAWSQAFFPQDGDAIRPTSTVSWRQTRTATATLSVYDASGALVRHVFTDRSLAAGTRTWTWNGRRADGTLVPQGWYAARLTVTSGLGTLTLQRGVWAAGFTISPSASSVAPGQTLAVIVSTVEPLAAAPRVTFTQPGRAGVTVTATRLADGRYRATFKVAAGTAGPGGIKVTGRDTAGHTNTTSTVIAVRAS
jgi:flagellar hook assembly protein FlgD